MSEQSRAVVPSDQNYDLEAAMPVEPAKAAQWLLYIIAGFIVFILVWASLAKLDRVTRGEGRVVSSNQLQEVQYLEGGIVKEILVASGAAVQAGDVLVKLDPTQMNVEFAQGQEGFNQLTAQIARLEAQAAHAPLRFPPAFSKAAPHITSSERALYDARMAELTASLEIEQNKLNQRLQTLEDAKVALVTAEEAHELAAQEHTMVQSLVSKGIEPRVELLRAQQRAAAARGEFQRAEIAVARIELEVAEAEGEITRIRKTFSADAEAELNETRAELEALKGELPALQDKVARTEVRAPVTGVVNRVLVSTVGGVVDPGETIVEIVPSEDSLVVEAKIKQSDIGFLDIGQSAKVSVTAYDSSIYGSMDGAIETISPDAIQDEDTGEYFYSITVRTSDEAIRSRKGEFKILSGMAAEVSILNGKRTVLSYLMNPISKVSGKALREQ